MPTRLPFLSKALTFERSKMVTQLLRSRSKTKMMLDYVAKVTRDATGMSRRSRAPARRWLEAGALLLPIRDRQLSVTPVQLGHIVKPERDASVSTSPGQTALTRMPLRRKSPSPMRAKILLAATCPILDGILIQSGHCASLAAPDCTVRAYSSMTRSTSSNRNVLSQFRRQRVRTKYSCSRSANLIAHSLSVYQHQSRLRGARCDELRERALQ